MKIAAIDLQLAASGGTRLDHLAFMQPQALDEFDTVIWNPAGTFPEFESRLERRSPDVLSARASEEVFAVSRHWRQQFRRFLQRGGTMVLILPPPRTFGIHTLQEVIDYAPLEPLTALLPSRASIAHAEPGTPHCRAGDPFLTFFEHVGDALQPQAILTDFPGIAILQDDAGLPLAAYVSLPPGRVLLLPALTDNAIADAVHSKRFVEALRHCTERLGCVTGIHNAAWMESYRTVAEQDLIGRQNNLLRKIGTLQEELNTTQKSIEQLEFQKQLVGGEGSGVRLAIAELFRKKGAFVQQDWLEEGLLIVELSERLLVVKVHLPEETLETGYFAALERARTRIADYFNKPVCMLLADCAENARGIEERTAAPVVAALVRPHQVLYLQGIHLYGWLMQVDGPGPEALTAALEWDDEALWTSLQQSASTSLVRAVNSRH